MGSLTYPAAIATLTCIDDGKGKDRCAINRLSTNKGVYPYPYQGHRVAGTNPNTDWGEAGYTMDSFFIRPKMFIP